MKTWTRSSKFIATGVAVAAYSFHMKPAMGMQRKPIKKGTRVRLMTGENNKGKRGKFKPRTRMLKRKGGLRR